MSDVLWLYIRQVRDNYIDQLKTSRAHWKYEMLKKMLLLCVVGGLGALAGPGLASLLGSGGPATSSSTSRFVLSINDHVMSLYWHAVKISYQPFLKTLLSSRSQSAAATPSSGSAARISSTQAPTTPVTPATTSTGSPTVTPTTPAAQTPSIPAAPSSSTQPIQLSDLQSILATMNVPAIGAEGQGGEGQR